MLASVQKDRASGLFLACTKLFALTHPKVESVRTPVFWREADVKNKSGERGIILPSQRRVF